MFPYGWFKNTESYAIGKEMKIEPRTVRKYIKGMCDIGLIEGGKVGTYRKLPMPTMPRRPE